MIGIKDAYGEKIGMTEALLDHSDIGAENSIADKRFLTNIGLEIKDLDEPSGRYIKGAAQKNLEQLGKISVKLSYKGNTAEDTITIVKGQLEAPLLINWSSTVDLKYGTANTASINRVICTDGIGEKSFENSLRQ